MATSIDAFDAVAAIEMWAQLPLWIASPPPPLPLPLPPPPLRRTAGVAASSTIPLVSVCVVHHERGELLLQVS